MSSWHFMRHVCGNDVMWHMMRHDMSMNVTGRLGRDNIPGTDSWGCVLPLHATSNPPFELKQQFMMKWERSPTALCRLSSRMYRFRFAFELIAEVCNAIELVWWMAWIRAWLAPPQGRIYPQTSSIQAAAADYSPCRSTSRARLALHQSRPAKRS